MDGPDCIKTTLEMPACANEHTHTHKCIYVHSQNTPPTFIQTRLCDRKWRQFELAPHSALFLMPITANTLAAKKCQPKKKKINKTPSVIHLHFLHDSISQKDKITEFHSMNISNLVSEGGEWIIAGGWEGWAPSASPLSSSNWGNLFKRKLLPQALLAPHQLWRKTMVLISYYRPLTSAAVPSILPNLHSTRGALIESGRRVRCSQRCCLTSLREQTFLDP